MAILKLERSAHKSIFPRDIWEENIPTQHHIEELNPEILSPDEHEIISWSVELLNHVIT